MCKSKAKNTGATNSNSNIPVVNQVKPNGPVFNPNASGIQPGSTNPAGIGQLVVPGSYQSGISSNQVAPLRQSKIVIPGSVSSNTLTSAIIGGNTNVPIDQKLSKSQVHVKQVNDPTIRTFFKDCVTQRIQLTKVTNEHNSYVRNHDYFDVSNGHYKQLENVRPIVDPKLAMYGVSEGSTLSTPTVNKFIYNQNIVDVNYQPKNSAYTSKYQLVTEQHHEAARNQFTYSDVKPVYNADNKPVIPGYNANFSTVRPYAETNNLTYNQQISNASQPQQSYGTSQGYSQPGTSQAYNYQPSTSQSYNLPASGTSQGYYPTSGPSQTVITTPPIASSTVQPVMLNTSQRGSLGLL